MATATLAFLSSPHSPKPPQNPNPNPPSIPSIPPSRRQFFFNTASLALLSLTLQYSPIPLSSSAQTSPPKSSSILSGIANTKSWFQFFGSGFAIRVPPEFEDMTEPDDYNAGLSLYGDKAKTKTYAARFSSPDGSEVVSVVIRPSNQLKITFLEAKDITDMGSLKEAAKLFVPGGSNLYSARTIKIKEDEGFRTYYFYEFGRDEEHFALVATVDSGKVFIAGAAAPEFKWDDDAVIEEKMLNDGIAKALSRSSNEEILRVGLVFTISTQVLEPESQSRVQ